MANMYIELIYYYLMITFDIFMILGPNLGFVAQIMKFRQMKSSEGFSKLLSFILIIANILRIFFWIGKRFSTPLLLQSILGILMQMYVLKECLKYSNEKSKNFKTKCEKMEFSNIYSINTIKNSNNSQEAKDFQSTNKTTLTGDLRYLYEPIVLWDFKIFWNWPYLIDYAYFLSIFSLIIGFISQIIGYDNKIYVEILGSASASLEALIGIPQVINNYKSKNTESLSTFMIYTWVFGDSVKTFYFIKTSSPLQLICCGLFQLTVDVIISFQIFYYSKFGINNKSQQLDSLAKKEDDIDKGYLNLSNHDQECANLNMKEFSDNEHEEFVVSL